MGGFWSRCKSENRLTKKPYSKLLENQLLKENYEAYLELVESKKDVTTVSSKEKVDQLIQYVEENGTIPPQNKTVLFADNVCMGSFWGYCKTAKRLTKEPYSKLLENQLLKENYEAYLELVESKKDVTTVSPEEKVEQLIQHVEENGAIPPVNKTVLFTDNSCMGSFWQSCKTAKKLTKEPYSKLLENALLKKNYEEYLEKKQEVIGQPSLPKRKSKMKLIEA
jgi:predicted ArsR family transcriptional regulator